MQLQNYDHIILLAHGSTDPAWKMPFEALQKRVEQKYGVGKTTLAFMELTEPDLATVLANFPSSVKKVGVLPLFLAAGRHLRHDVPKQIEALSTKSREIDLLAPIGDHDVLQNAMLDIIAEQLGM
ncbi:cobalamin biosynthesis protein CbiX [Marinomonas agarivorans]|nr:cobalamin biosynthesis protein CbiX [Marinomonas agarivorans]